MKKRSLAILGITLALLCLSIGYVGAVPSVTKWLLRSQVNLLTTELNSLSNNGLTVVSATFNNTAGGGGGDGYTMCDIEFFGTFASAPLAGSAMIVWFLLAPDGTNFETTPTASVSVGRAPNVVLPVSAGTTVTRVNREVMCPPGLFRVVAKSEGTGQSLAASGNLLRIRMFTPEGF